MRTEKEIEAMCKAGRKRTRCRGYGSIKATVYHELARGGAENGKTVQRRYEKKAI